MLVVITAGGVKEKIDNVRSITNSSSGKLGQKIAKSFLEKEPSCNLIYIYGGAANPYPNDNRVENIKIKDTQDLLDTVSHILISQKVDIFIHSMAVADYTTKTVFDLNKLKDLVEGKFVDNFNELLDQCKIDNNNKMSSYMESPAIVLTKTPKVIEHIKKLSPFTFLVGFKLLDNVSENELFNVGFNLLRKNRCNLVLANDIHQIREGNHQGMIIYPEKTYDIIDGKDNIANYLVKKSLERYSVKHPKSIQLSTNNNIDTKTFNDFYNMGQWLNQESFLPKVINHDRIDKIGTYGNMSVKKEGCFYITCRNVNKANLNNTDISKISRVELTDNTNVYSKVFYNSELKPSIDTTIHSEIYRYSKYSHIVHIHTNKVFLGIPLISESYPCGCDKECLSIVDVIAMDPTVDVIQMYKHGLIILANSFEGCKEKITNLFNNVPYIDYDDNNLSEECIKHIKDTKPEFGCEKNFFALKLSKENIGCIYEEMKDNQIHFGLYTMKNIRNKRLNIVRKYLMLRDKEYILHTTIDCNIADFYKTKYGFVDLDVSNKRNMMLKSSHKIGVV